jgi:protein-tyrosine phosphatase
MAAEYFRHHAAQRGLSHVIVDSAGTLGIEGSPASDEAIVAMREIGVNLSAHRSKGLTSEMLRNADLAIGMTRGHLEQMAQLDPQGRERQMLLRAFERGAEPNARARGLKDPIGRPLGFYREQVPLIAHCLDHLILHLKHST